MKLCPRCNTKCLNSAVACDCGFSFLGEPAIEVASVAISEPQLIAQPKPSGVRGWLLLLIIQLAILIPAHSVMALLALHSAPSIQAMSELGANITDADQVFRAMNDPRFTTKRQEVYRRDGYVFRQIDQAFFGLTALVTAFCIFRGNPAAYGSMRLFVVGSFITGLLVLFLSRGGLWPETVIPFAVFCVWALTWWLYFERSTRVRQTLA